MSDAIVYIDNYQLGHADSWSSAIQARGMVSVAIGHARDCAALTQVDWGIPIDRFDAVTIESALVAVEQTYRIRGIRCMFGPEENGHSVAALVADARGRRGLAGPSAEAIALCNVKSLTRDALDAANIENVAYAVVRSADEAAAFARDFDGVTIMKPLTGVAAGLIRRCAAPADAARGFADILRHLPHAHHRPLRSAGFTARTPWGEVAVDPRRSVLIEAYIDGPEISVECLALADRVIPLVVHDKIMLDEDGWTVREPLLVAPPARFGRADVRVFKAYAAACVSATGLTDTLCHVELRIDPVRGPLLLEINPRIGAGCIRDSLQTFWGLDPIATDIDLVCGAVPAITTFERTNRAHAMIFVFTEHHGRLRAIDGLESVLRQPGVLAVRRMAQNGDAVDGRREEQFLVGIWRRLRDGQSAEQAYAQALSAIAVHIEPRALALGNADAA